MTLEIFLLKKLLSLSQLDCGVIYRSCKEEVRV